MVQTGREATDYTSFRGSSLCRKRVMMGSDWGKMGNFLTEHRGVKYTYIWPEKDIVVIFGQISNLDVFF